MHFHLPESCKCSQVPQVCAGTPVRYSPSMRADVTVQKCGACECLPLQLYRIQLTKDKKDRLQPESDSREKEIKEIPLICSHCSAAITTSNQAISINGQHEHAFFNPSGIAFEIRCFRQAPGCQVQGEPTTEFSWFDGYSWQYAICSNCLVHLGWFFSSGENSFFGLIAGKII